MSEEGNVDLPDVLKKLDILTPLPLGKMLDDNLPLSFNPFYYQGVCKDKQTEKLEEIFGDEYSCSCRANTIEHRIIKQSSFKNKHNGKILKEPVLKSMQNCIHYSHIRHKKLSNLTGEKVRSLEGCPDLDALKLGEDANRSDGLIGKRDLLDFRQLFDEIDIVTTTSVCKFSNNKLPNFTKTQSFEPRLKCSKKAKKSQSVNSQKLRLEQNSNANASSSCAQQARIVASSTCDVTIDELASYFETFVHIPKKMSSMAEMMYI